jgi:23S rRNA (cytidine1920-2'-O)/16S rRNA (cytidine1409-2'-O)-methyltransferase
VTRKRLDVELVRRGMAESRAAAASLIASGRVTVRGAPADKPARLVDPSEPVVIVGEPDRYVGRGGHKLAAALVEFGVDPTAWRVLDAGASTGGFTDCLLQHGAAQVIAVDVGHGQLHERLRADPRVVVRERQNVRSIQVADLDGPVDAAVADLSFISLDKVLEPIAAVVRPGGDLIALVKPQFEAGRQEVSKGRGVISDPAVWRRVLRDVLDTFRGHGAAIMGVMVSPLRGADGNVEFLVHARVGADPADDRAVDVDALVSSVLAEGEPGEGEQG